MNYNEVVQEVLTESLTKEDLMSLSWRNSGFDNAVVVVGTVPNDRASVRTLKCNLDRLPLDVVRMVVSIGDNGFLLYLKYPKE